MIPCESAGKGAVDCEPPRSLASCTASGKSQHLQPQSAQQWALCGSELIPRPCLNLDLLCVIPWALTCFLL